MPESKPTFDLDWALPLVPLTPKAEIVFSRLRAFIGLAKQRGTTPDSALQRWLVVFLRLFSLESFGNPLL